MAHPQDTSPHFLRTFKRADAPHLKRVLHCREVAEAGYLRESADAYLKAYTGPSRSWRWRYVFLRGYTVCLGQPGPRDFTASLDDAEALRRIADDPSLTIVERVRASHFCADVLWDHGSLVAAHTVNAKVADLAKQATPKHRAELMPYFAGARSRWMPIAELLDPDVKKCAENMGGIELEAGTLGEDPPQSTAPAGAPCVASGNLRWPVMWTDEADRVRHEAALRGALKDRSAECSQCGARGGGGCKLRRCAKCRQARYCSAECQRAQWKTHEPQCRTPGEFEAGAIVRLQLRHHGQGQFARVLMRDPANACSWLVDNESWGDRTPMSVQTDGMQHVLTH